MAFDDGSRSAILDSVKKKFLITVGVTAIVVFAVMVFLTISQATGQVSQVTNEKLESKSLTLANDLNTDLKEDQKFAETLSATMENYNRSSASRAEINNVLKQLAEENPDALGVYVAYEPDAFDGNDSQYVNDSATGSNADGRFAPYWNRYGGSLNRVALENLDSQAWYTEPVRTGEPIIKGPFTYQGRLMLSFVYPIKRHGEVVGIAGIDVPIDYWQNQTDQIQVADSGYAFVVSNEGKFVAHPNDSWVGTETLQTVAENESIPALQGMSQGVENGSGGNFTMADPVTGSNAIVQYQPVETGGFAIGTVAPKNEVLAGVHNLRTILLGISGVSLLVLLGVVFGITRRVTEPIERVTADLEQIAETGDLSIRTDISTNDEIEAMATSLHKTLNDTQESMDHIRQASLNLQNGTLDQEVTTDLPGEFGEIMEALEDGLTQVTDSFEQIHQASKSIKTGRLDQSIDTDQPGQYGEVLDNLAAGTAQLAESFEQITTASKQLEEGRLTQDLDTSYPGSYGDVLANLQNGVDQLRGSVESIQKIADQVAASSEEVSSSIEETEAASDLVANSVEDIAHGADKQSENIQQVANEMNQLSATIEEVASSAEEVTATAATAVDRSETGREYASEATEEISAIEAEAAAASSQVETLDEEMAQIAEIVDMITDIAEQTNILALNASIEAARAGKAGEGFAVVANEIKTLATEAGQATAKIEDRIEAVQATTDDTVEGIESMNERVRAGATTIEETIDMFDEIARAVQEAEQGIEEISDATDDQAASAEEVVSMADDVSDVSQQTASEASNVSAATEEQTSSLTEATESVQQLAELADSLHGQVSDFEVESDATTAMNQD